MQTVSTGSTRRWSRHDARREAERVQEALLSQRSVKAKLAEQGGTLVATYDIGEVWRPEPTTHRAIDDRDVRHAAKGAKRIHWEHASWASSKRAPKGKPLKFRDRVKLLSYDGASQRFTRFRFSLAHAALIANMEPEKAERVKLHHMTKPVKLTEARRMWLMLARGGAFAPLRRITEQQANVLDENAAYLVANATEKAREQHAKQEKLKALFDAHRSKEGPIKPHGHSKWCGCHPCHVAKLHGKR